MRFFFSYFKKLRSFTFELLGKYLKWCDKSFKNSPQTKKKYCKRGVFFLLSTDALEASWVPPCTAHQKKRWNKMFTHVIFLLSVQVWFSQISVTSLTFFFFTDETIASSNSKLADTVWCSFSEKMNDLISLSLKKKRWHNIQ